MEEEEEEKETREKLCWIFLTADGELLGGESALYGQKLLFLHLCERNE